MCVIKFIFKNNTSCLKRKDSISTIWRITRGVRRGGVTLPYLFCLYIDHILTRIAENKQSRTMGVNRVNIQSYADELVYFAQTAAGLKILEERIQKLISGLELMISVAKTNVVVFKHVGRASGANVLFEYRR